MKRLLCLLVPVLFLAGCDNPQTQVDQIRKEITEFRDAPNDQKKAQIEQNLAKLQKQVDEMKAKGSAKADEYQRKLEALETDYQTAKVGRVLDEAKRAIQGFGDALKEGAKSIEQSLKQDSTNQ